MFEKGYIDPIQNWIFLKETIFSVLLSYHHCFKHYIVQILALKSYTLLKPHPVLLQCSPRHCLWYFTNFMTNKIFQFVSYLWPTFKDWKPSGNSRRDNHKGNRSDVQDSHGMSMCSEMNFNHKFTVFTILYHDDNWKGIAAGAQRHNSHPFTVSSATTAIILNLKDHSILIVHFKH